MQPVIEFDIRTSLGRTGLADHHIRSDREDKLTSGEIIEGLASLVKYLKPQDWMVWRFGTFVLPTGPKGQRALGVPVAVELGSALKILSRCEGFDKFLQAFENPVQFDDTLFEARMARWCIERP